MRTLGSDLAVRWTLAVLLLFTLLLVAFPRDEAGRRFAPVLFLLLGLWALRRRIREVRAGDERRFWNDLSLAVASWLGWSVFTLILARFFSLYAATLIGEVFYTVFYVATILAVERQPHRYHRWRPVALERRLTWPTVSVAVGGLFLYFLLIPAAAVEGPSYSRAQAGALYLILDVFLVVRLIQLWRAAHSPRWRTLYLLIAAAALVLLACDLLSPRGALLVPLSVFFLVLAARARHHRFPREPKPSASEVRLEENLPGPLGRTMLFAVLFPLVHYVGYRGGRLDPELRGPRETLVFVVLLVLGALALLQYRSMKRTTEMLHTERSRVEKGLDQVEKDLRIKVELQRTLAARRTSNERFAQAFHACPDVMALIRLEDGHITDINQSCASIFGLEPQEIIGHTSEELGLWADSRDREKVRRTLRKEGTVRDFDGEFRKKSGETGRALLSAAAIELEGKPFVFVILRDVTPSRRAREADEHRAAALGQARCAVFSVDPEGRIASWNLGAEELWGRAAEEVLGRPAAAVEGCGELLPPAEGATVKATRIRRRRFELRHREGRHLVVDGCSAPLDLKAGPRSTLVVAVATEAPGAVPGGRSADGED